MQNNPTVRLPDSETILLETGVHVLGRMHKIVLEIQRRLKLKTTFWIIIMK